MVNGNTIWEHFTLQQRIAALITYASVFNDVISIEEIEVTIDPQQQNKISIQNELSRLYHEELICLQNGYAAIPALKAKIERKKTDRLLVGSIIEKRIRYLHILQNIPFVKFIGISGSLSAGNPKENHKRNLDVDVFMITKRNCMWVMGFFDALYRNSGIRSIMKFPFCFNFIMDESDMLIYNQNFYTATEIKNLIPVYGFQTYRRFLKSNEWVYRYYPHLKRNDSECLPDHVLKKSGVFNLNKYLFVLFHIFRCIKNLSFSPLREMSLIFNPVRSHNFNRRSSEHGGYQFFIRKKFEKNMKHCFPGLYDQAIISAMFDDPVTHKIFSMYHTLDIKRFSIGRKYLDNLILNTSKYE